MLNEEILASINESVLCWLATCDEHGFPNCSPKEVFLPYGDSHILIANIASPESVNNIQSNENVCISFVHVLKQKGFKIKGKAEYIDSESAEYNTLFPKVEPIVGDVFPVKGIIKVRVISCSKIIAPGYYLVKGATEESQIESAKRAYGI